ncbi:MAG: ribonucleoside-diphosphate reductase [Xanthomonadales bacterium]|nr:ribonucleoside-diphosphate reductase [Xanthomonadales bacterium]
MGSVQLEVMNTENKILPLQSASLDIWDKKYRLKDKNGNAVDESIDDTFIRVARALSEVELDQEKREHWYQEFLWALRRGAIPAGRITSNAGAQEHKPATSTINCTVSGIVEDSMHGILDKVHEAGLTLKAGCGIGYEFSTLRPKGAYVSGAGAHTSGPLSFMDIYDKMCFTVSSAGGRRGAQMATFEVGHPDVMEFVRAKREAGRLRQFNCSLLITNEFMQAVESEQNWPLAFPISKKDADDIELADAEQVIWRDWPTTEGYITNEVGEVACKIYKQIPSRRLWDMIMASTYDFAEPGFILIDSINDTNNNWFCENIRATNPCVTADTWVQTDTGPKQVADLIGTSFTALVDGISHKSGEQGFFRTANKPVLRLETTEGYSLKLTADHRLRRVSKFTRYSTETEWCAASELIAGDRVLLNDHRQQASWLGSYNRDQGYLMGLLLGDGTVKTDKTILSVWSQAMTVNGDAGGIDAGTQSVMTEALAAVKTLPHRSDFNGWQAVSGRSEYRLSTAAIGGLADTLGFSPGNKHITAPVESASSEFYRGFLRGFFDADGSVQGTQKKGVSVRLSQSHLQDLQAVQRMLLRLGIASTVYRNRREAGKRLLPDGRGGKQEYQCKANHELIISGESIRQFKQLIGFADVRKQARLEQLLESYQRDLNRERFVARVVSVKAAGVEDVYDVQVPGINTFDANGLHAHNCGEQPLPPYGACLLGSINLTRYVEKPFTEEASFNWDDYHKTVKIFSRMLDNVVDINGLPLAQQRAEIERKRRHGMGFLGLGSSLTMQQMKYGSPESLEFTEKVSREMALAGWEEALELSREKGPAPIMNEVFEVTQKMLRQRPEMIADGYKLGDKVAGKVLFAKYSRYMQKIAKFRPELVAALAEEGARWTHHTSIAPTGTISLSLGNNVSNGIEPSFAHHYSRNVIREGRKSKEKVEVYSYELLAYREYINAQAMPNSDKVEEKLPDYFITADSVAPCEHVDVQAAAQIWIDSSISKTANVPTDYPYEDFKDIYMYAWKKGLKGCTTFRFNPEAFQGVLVKEEDLEKTIYRFVLDDGQIVEVKGNEEIDYDGEIHTAANLFDALKEGYYGKF